MLKDEEGQVPDEQPAARAARGSLSAGSLAARRHREVFIGDAGSLDH
jgi:hypothetical protein